MSTGFVNKRLVSLIGITACCFTVHRIWGSMVIRSKKTTAVEEAEGALPEEIIEEILSRLPVKSLFKFKIVSKKWYSLISNNDYFAKLHLNQSKNLIFFQNCDAIFQFTDINTNTIGSSSSRKIPIPDLIKNPKIIGSANGLICLGSHTYFFCFIWNPSTGDCERIPIPAECRNRLQGFGYDSVSDDYKIIGEWDSKFQIFSLKSNSSRVPDENPFLSMFLNSWSVFINGVIYWIISPKRIIAFDLVEEKFFPIELPEIINGGIQRTYSPLFNYQGSLCVFDRNSPVMTVWIMKEHGNTKSWAKFFTVVSSEHETPFCIPRLGEVVFETRVGLAKYNGQGKMCEVEYECVRFFTHSETLIWPKSLKMRTCLEEKSFLLNQVQWIQGMKTEMYTTLLRNVLIKARWIGTTIEYLYSSKT